MMLPVSFYPNPANDEVIIEITLKPSENATSIEVYNLTGNLVLRKTPNDGVSITKWDTSSVPSGLYFCRLVQVGTVLSSGKIAIQH
jgi:Secretion system C-terminal sorting domain